VLRATGQSQLLPAANGDARPEAASERIGFDRQKQTFNVAVAVAVEVGAAYATLTRPVAAHASARDLSQARRDIGLV